MDFQHASVCLSRIKFALTKLPGYCITKAGVVAKKQLERVSLMNTLRIYLQENKVFEK